MKLERLFEDVLKEAGTGNPRGSQRVKIKVYDGNFIIDDFDLDGQDNWECDEERGEYTFTGTISEFRDGLHLYGDIDWRGVNLKKCIEVTPVGKGFTLYGRRTDSIYCEVLEK